MKDKTLDDKQYGSLSSVSPDRVTNQESSNERRTSIKTIWLGAQKRFSLSLAQGSLVVATSMSASFYALAQFGFSASSPLLGLFASIGIAAGILSWVLTAPTKRRQAGLQCVIAALLLFGIMNSIQGFLPIPRAGDGSDLIRYLNENFIFSRWLLGSFLLNVTYAAGFHFPPLQAALAPAYLTSEFFLKLAGPLLSCTFVIMALRQFASLSLAVGCFLVSPMALLFLLGYIEYYPIFMGPMLYILCWISAKPLNKRSALEVGLAAAVLQAIYVGFAPFVLALHFGYLIAMRREALKSWAWSIVFFLIIVRICYPTPPTQFFLDLWRDMNFRAIAIPRYYGTASGPTAITFSWDFIFSIAHFKDKSYLYCFGAGVLLLPLAAFSFITLACDRLKTLNELSMMIQDGRPVFFALLLGSLWYSFLKLIPLLGPTQDIDLFSTVYFVTSFALGLSLSFWRTTRSLLQRSVVCCLIASNLVTFSALLHGVPAI